MNRINEGRMTIALRDLMDGPEGWGREQGREVYRRLLDFVEAHPGVMVFRVSMRGVRRADISFASEPLVELARRFRGAKGFCLVDLSDPDLLENWEAAAARKGQPILLWDGNAARTIGVEPSHGTRAAFAFALARPETRAAEFARAAERVSIANASTKFKQLWEQGFLLRRENAAGSGGVEYTYHRIG